MRDQGLRDNVHRTNGYFGECINVTLSCLLSVQKSDTTAKSVEIV